MKTKIIWQYYILSCLFSAGGLSFISAVYVTYLMKHGLGLFEVNIVNAMYFLTLFLCEIPTGAFADIFGRKTSFVVACALMSISMFIYGLSDSMTGFIIAEMIGAVGMTFRSGAFKAWLVDSLKHYGDHGPYTKIFARQNLICQIARNPPLPWHHFDELISKSCHTPQTNICQRYEEMQLDSSTKVGVQERLEDI